MIVQLTVAAGVITLAVASAWANYLHVAPMGGTIVALVIGAELFKFAAPVAMRDHMTSWRPGAFLATLAVWLIVVAFSFANTFGNALTRHAMEEARHESARESHARPAHVVLRDIAALPRCGKRGSDDCMARRDRVAALQAELALARKRGDTSSAPIVRGDPIRSGMIQLAAFVSVELPSDRVFVLVTLVWTLLAEVGSALGALAIPRRKAV